MRRHLLVALAIAAALPCAHAADDRRAKVAELDKESNGCRITGEVVTWPAAPGTTATNGAFTVKVNGRPVDVIEIPKPTQCLKGDDAHPYYAAFFDADEEVDVEVVGLANMRRTRILPTRRGIAPEVKGEHVVGFRAKPPFNVAVEPSGRHGALVIAANVPERDAPKKDDPNVVYFGPGRHRRDNAITLGSGQTLYLAPGAYVEGWVKASGTNMTIRGRGILSGLPWQWGKGPVGWMVAAQGRDIVVKDVTLMSSWTWMLVFNEAENVLVDNIKLLNGRTLNDDGIDICRSRHVAIRNSFIRSQDDCIAPKYWCEDLTVENCALWTDVANVIRVGYECLGRDYPFRNHRYRNIDVLHQAIHNDKSIDDYWTENTISIQPSNDAMFEDMVFENFAFDAPQVQDLFLTLRTTICQFGRNPITQGGHARNITFRDIHFPVSRPLGSYGIWLHSADPEHIVEDVTFENLEAQEEFHVPVGIRGVVKNIKGLPCRK